MSETKGTDLIVSIARKIGATVLPDNAQWQNRMEIRSESSSRLYTVAQRKTSGEWCCSCFGWKRYRHCKHLDTMKPALVALDKRGAINAAR